MFSAFLGRTGRRYLRDKLLKVHPSKSEYNVYLAHCEGKHYVVKKVSPSIFQHSQELRQRFGNGCRLRLHIDDNQDERLLVYEYFKQDLLSLIGATPSLSIKTRKHILREVGLALQTLHSRQWIHLDLKPDNILLDWMLDESDDIEIQRVALADLDCALRLKGSKPLNQRIGNVMWRSPEGQAGRGVGKPSEVFSYGLICLYTITGAEVLHPDFEQLKKDGTEPEHLILYKLLSMFGPAPRGLLACIDDQYWNELLSALSEVVIEEGPLERFEQWGQSKLPNMDYKTIKFILRMTDLDPVKRATLDDVMDDPWWQE